MADVVPVETIAAAYGVPASAVRQWIQRYQLPASFDGLRWAVSRTAFAAWLDRVAAGEVPLRPGERYRRGGAPAPLDIAIAARTTREP
jgi:hypothetical protein